MNDLAREKLTALVAEHGRSVINMTGSCGMLLRLACPTCQPEVAVLMQTLQLGIPIEMNKNAPAQPWPELADPWVQHLIANDVPEEDARWAVDSWGMALGKHPSGKALAPEKTLIQERAWEKPKANVKVPLASNIGGKMLLGHFIIVGVLGFIGGVLPAFYIWITPEKDFDRLGSIFHPRHRRGAEPILEPEDEPIDPAGAEGQPQRPAMVIVGGDQDPTAPQQNPLGFRELKKKPALLLTLAGIAGSLGGLGSLMGYMWAGYRTSVSPYGFSGFCKLLTGGVLAFEGSYVGTWIGIGLHDTVFVALVTGALSFSLCRWGTRLGQQFPMIAFVLIGSRVLEMTTGRSMLGWIFSSLDPVAR